MAYASISKPSLHFNTKTYTGNASTQSITGVGFQPDLVWAKNRGTTAFHIWTDAVRGATKVLQSNTTTAEQTFANGLTSFDSDGFSAGNSDDVNGNYNYVSWNWKANGQGSSNTDGSITSTVSVNTTAGFSIVKWTGISGNGTLGHGLGSAPSVVITKALSTTGGWFTYHKSIGATKYIMLHSTNAEATDSTAWNSTDPTSTVFTYGSGLTVSGTEYVAYCFAEKKGYSKFGSYTGNGSADGTFIYTGFKPALVIFKSTGGTESWSMVDNKRDTDNVVKNQLFPNLSNAEETTNNVMDFCSNGFKMRNSDTRYNSSSYTYIYMAFAENPIVGSNDTPATAR